eukprot:6245227-Karenia_brevis.AAC.1
MNPQDDAKGSYAQAWRFNICVQCRERFLGLDTSALVVDTVWATGKPCVLMEFTCKSSLINQQDVCER